MKWKGRRASTNVTDARGQSMGRGGAGVGVLLDVVLRIFGLKGLLVLAVLGFAGWQMGRSVRKEKAESAGEDQILLSEL